ncbi:MAG: PQQ-binding-like beta-propeller repeat protein [Actinomycetota bacterium]
MDPSGSAEARDHVAFWPAVTLMVAAAVGVIGLATASGRPAPAAGPGDGASAPINTTVPGLTTFRGNAARTWYGEGPVPSDPAIRWTYPSDGTRMCSFSAEGGAGSPTKEWCGTGWTGQPNVVPLSDGSMMVREGAYDGHYHFLDAGSGAPLMPDLVTGDLAKGSATSDPDGFPLYYAGSRDNLFRVVAMDRSEPTVLYEIDSHDTSLAPHPMWNDDWDGAALVVDDVLIEGSENGYLYLVPLHRAYDPRGLVTIHPDAPIVVPGFDQELLSAVAQSGEITPDGLDTRYDVSIESSVAYRDGVVYVANSGGLITGWDISDVLNGGGDVHRVFRFWTGDDTDGTIAIDDEGFLYVASEYQRFDDTSRSLGQLIKLDPRQTDPVVWSVPALELGFEGAGGSWSTPALAGGVAYFTTAAGRVLAIDRETGTVLWERQIASPSIASPVVVDGTLLQGDCSGHLYAWDVSDPNAQPTLRWNLDLGDCIESTPAVWHGWLFVGTREGYLYGIADAGTPAPDAGQPQVVP